MRADDFVAFDEFLAGSQYPEIAEKRSSHKRAFIRNGIMVEVLIAKPVNGSTRETVFWDTELFVWPVGTFELTHCELPIVSGQTIAAYEGEHARLQRASPFPAPGR